MDMHHIKSCIDNRIQEHQKRVLEKLDTMSGEEAEKELKYVLEHCNPYTCKMKYGALPLEQFAELLVRDYCAKSFETLFGKTLEAISCDIADGNELFTSIINHNIPGIDEIRISERIKTIFLFQKKSGSFWSNSTSSTGLVKNFIAARNYIANNHPGYTICCVNGCFYGRGHNEKDKNIYTKKCGQEYLDQISGIENFHIEVMKMFPTEENNFSLLMEEKMKKVINIFIKKITELEFANQDATIDWLKIIEFNSGKARRSWKKNKKTNKVVIL